MRRLFLAGVVAVAVAGSQGHPLASSQARAAITLARVTQPTASAQDREPPWLTNLRTWSSAVLHHQPGTLDGPVLSIAPWSIGGLRSALADTRSLRGRLARHEIATAIQLGALVTTYGGVKFTVGDLVDLFGLRKEEWLKGDLNRFLKRAAALHADVARLAPRPSVTTVPVLRELGGQQNSVESGTEHWEFGRMLVAAIRPSPSQAVLEAARRSDAVVYGVSSGPQRGPTFLKDLCAATGGSLLTIGTTEHLSEVLVSVLDEFRQRYLVSYSPRGVPQAGWHKLQVRIRNRSVKVNARPGYVAGF